MKEIEVTIKNKLGIHVRPSSLFVKTALEFQSNIKIIKDNKEYDGKSVFDLLMLEARQNTKFKILAEGPDEEEAINVLYDLVMIKTFNEE